MVNKHKKKFKLVSNKRNAYVNEILKTYQVSKRSLIIMSSVVEDIGNYAFSFTVVGGLTGLKFFFWKTTSNTLNTLKKKKEVT